MLLIGRGAPRRRRAAHSPPRRCGRGRGGRRVATTTVVAARRGCGVSEALQGRAGFTAPERLRLPARRGDAKTFRNVRERSRRTSSPGSACMPRATSSLRSGGGGVGDLVGLRRGVLPARRAATCRSRRRCWPRWIPPSAGRRRWTCPAGKNLAGAFRQPSPRPLRHGHCCGTLPESDRPRGLRRTVAKYGVLDGAAPSSPGWKTACRTKYRRIFSRAAWR